MTKKELIVVLAEHFPSCEGWHDSCEIALYWYANDYHSGQWSDLYSILSTSPYRPSCLTRGIDDDDDDLAADMYYFLVDTYHNRVRQG